jgi:MFS family permease
VTTGPAADDRTKARRELTLTVLLCALGSLVELLAVGRTWVTASTSLQGHAYTGNDLASAARPLAFVALAGTAALLATKRWGRVAVGVLLVAAAVGMIVAIAAAGDPSVAGTLHHHPGWRVVALVGVVPILLAGLAAAARGNRWSVMSSRYDAPGAVRERAQDPDVALWEALDRGDDPTG